MSNDLPDTTGTRTPVYQRPRDARGRPLAPASPAPPASRALSTPELLAGIADDIQRLLSRYVDLLRYDLHEEIGSAKKAASMIIVAGGVLIVGMILITLAISSALVYYTALPPWASHAIVGGVVTAAGATLAILGRKALAEVKTPEALPEAVEDATWIKENISEQKSTPR